MRRAACCTALLLLWTAIAGAQGTIALSGRVVDESGRPVPGALVVAGALRYDPATRQGRATTDGEGRFSIAGLAASPYRLSFSALGYVPDEEDAKRLYRPGESVTLRVRAGSVIAGTVTDADGEPAVGILVYAERVRTGSPRAYLDEHDERQAYADDRGIYRIYGLRAGNYLVSAGGHRPGSLTTLYDDEPPTFHPATTRASAVPVAVGVGEEVRDVNIRHHPIPAHTISGTISGVQPDPGLSMTMTVVTAAEGHAVASEAVAIRADPAEFKIGPVPDGEYIVGLGAANGESPSARRVTVRGADVTGVVLRLVPPGRIEGRVALDPLPAGARPAPCEPEERHTLGESVLEVVRDPRPGAYNETTAPDSKGGFSFWVEAPARYRLVVEPASRDWYVASITIDGPNGKPRPIETVEVAAGGRVTGLTARLSRGAAAVRGKVEPVEGVRVFLVPADPKSAEDPLRFYEAEPDPDGAFEVAHVAPGRYRILAHQPAPRADLRRAAEEAGRPVELGRCQRLEGLALHR